MKVLPYVELQFGVDDLRLLYKSVAVHYATMAYLKDIDVPETKTYLIGEKLDLFRIILEW